MSRLFKNSLILFCLCALASSAAAGTKEAKTAPQEESGFWEDFVNFFLPHAEKRRILLRKQTLYYMVTVEEDSRGWRHLVFNPVKGSQGIWDPKKPHAIISNYCKYMTLFMTMTSDHKPQRVLFIGLGVGIVPRFVARHFPGTKIDVVEIDPDIPEIARKYFAYEKTADTAVIIKDGRDFINRNKHKYDFVFIDAYSSREIPFQLTTAEFYGKVRDAMPPNGIVCVNIANLGKAQFIANEIKTIKSVFPCLDIYVCPGNSNYVVFASPEQMIDPAVQNEKARKLDSELKLDYKMPDIINSHMEQAEIKEMIADAIVLTDDYAPVETMK